MLILFILIIISGNCTLDIIAPQKRFRSQVALRNNRFYTFMRKYTPIIYK